MIDGSGAKEPQGPTQVAWRRAPRTQGATEENTRIQPEAVYSTRGSTRGSILASGDLQKGNKKELRTLKRTRSSGAVLAEPEEQLSSVCEIKTGLGESTQYIGAHASAASWGGVERLTHPCEHEYRERISILKVDP